MLSALPVKLDLQQLLVNGVAAGRRNAGDGAARPGRQQDFVLPQQAVLPDDAPDITTGDVVANLEVGGLEVPFLGTVKGGDRDAAGNVNASGGGADALQRALNTIINGLHQPGTELDGQRLSGSEDGVADRKTIGLFVNLNRGLVAVDSNDFTDQPGVTDMALQKMSKFVIA